MQCKGISSGPIYSSDVNGLSWSVCVEARIEFASWFGPPGRRAQRRSASCLTLATLSLENNQHFGDASNVATENYEKTKVNEIKISSSINSLQQHSLTQRFKNNSNYTKLISRLTLLISHKRLNMLNQIGLKPIMDVAIMQIFCDMYELLPTSSQN
jgi:hypothetical protein